MKFLKNYQNLKIQQLKLRTQWMSLNQIRYKRNSKQKEHSEEEIQNKTQGDKMMENTGGKKYNSDAG